jgi:CRP-like cAMP-binding protein
MWVSMNVYICGHSGQYFGELGLLFPIERTASAVAATFCDVFCLRYEDLHNIMKGEKLYKQFDIIKEIRISKNITNTSVVYRIKNNVQCSEIFTLEFEIVFHNVT